MQAKDKEIRGTKFVVAGLKEGGFYKFRVRAVNAAGIGEPGEVTEVIEIKDRIGIFHTKYIYGVYIYMSERMGRYMKAIIFSHSCS